MGGPGGGGARRFLTDRGADPGPMVLMVATGEVGRSPGVAQPDPELTLLSPALDWALSPRICARRS